MTQDLIETVEGRVATLTLNRPDRLNAFTPDMLAALQAALQRLAADPAVGAIILTGAGRGFCAGGDVKRMSAAPATPDGNAVSRLRQMMEVARLLHEIPKPTIAMVNGPAAGAGFSLAVACDLRMAGESAIFVTAFAKVGLPGDFGGSYFLTALVGAARARELYFTSDKIDARRAMEIGLVNRVVADAELGRETMAFAQSLAQGPTTALGLMKRNLNAALSGDLATLLNLEARHQIDAGATQDHREAARAFVEKRRPVFNGR